MIPEDNQNNTVSYMDTLLDRVLEPVPEYGEIEKYLSKSITVFSTSSKSHAKMLSNILGCENCSHLNRMDFNTEYLMYVGMFPDEIIHFSKSSFRDIKIIPLFIGSDILLLEQMMRSKDQYRQTLFKNLIMQFNLPNVRTATVFMNLFSELYSITNVQSSIITLVPEMQKEYLDRPKGKAIGIYVPNGVNKAQQMFHIDTLLELIKNNTKEKFVIFGNIGMFNVFNFNDCPNVTYESDFTNFINKVNINIRLTEHDGFSQTVIALMRNSIPTISLDKNSQHSPNYSYIIKNDNVEKENNKKGNKDQSDPKKNSLNQIEKILNNREELWNSVPWDSVHKIYREGYFSTNRMLYDLSSCLHTFDG
jgi:hypothetical protein